MSNQKHIAILLNGHIAPTPKLQSQLASTYVIAADGGISHAKALAVSPDIWIGDFDSTDAAQKTKHSDIETISYTTEKSISDGELAIEHAISLKPECITICGGLGGERSDHALFNMLGLVRYAHTYRKIKFRLTSGTEDAYPIIPEISLDLNLTKGSTFSVLALSKVSGLSITGVKWPLKDETVEMGSTHTLSNMALGKTVIQLSDGHAIAVVQTND